METMIMNVRGMTCMGCVNAVKNVLQPIPGVKSVDVILERGEVTIHFDPARADGTRFRDAVEEAGYEVAD